MDTRVDKQGVLRPHEEPLRFRPFYSNDTVSSASVDDSRPSSPPYRPVSSTSYPDINSAAYPPVPAYSSTAKLTEEMPEDTNHRNEPHVKGASQKPTVHYPDELFRGSPPVAPGYKRTESFPDSPPSRASSVFTDDEDSDDNYDWTGEEDLVDEEAKFEERMGVKTKPQGWGFKRIITILFSTLIGSTLLAGVLITPAILVQFYWYKPNPTSERRYIKDNIQSWLFWAAANLLISWYLAMIVDVIPLFAQFFISAFWGHVSEYVKTRIEMYDSVKHSIKPLLYAGCGWASWTIIFGHIYNLFNTADPNESRAAYTIRLAQVVEFFFFFALVICAKRMLSHAIAFSFHQTAYKDRIESVQESLDVIEKLRQYRPKPTTRKSGTRTPVFSHGQFSDKEHFRFLSRALWTATPGRKGTRPGYFDHDDGVDGDVEDGDRTVVGIATKESTLKDLKGKGKSKHRPTSTVDSIVGKQGSDGAGNDNIELETFLGDSRPGTPPSFPPSGTNSPHRYPPSPRNGSPRTSVENSNEGGETLIQAARAIKNAVLHDARNIEGNSEGLASVGWNVSSAHEAKRLARSIYMKFKDRGRTYLLPSDFRPAFADQSNADAAFRVFDKDNNGDISRGEVKNTLVRVYKERRFLSRSMRDVNAALTTLDYIILFFAMVILFFISLSVFGVQVGKSLTSVYSIGIAASFIFKNSASSAFDAIMFLFVTHPYDTGDRCFIDAEVLVVKKVGLFATVFTRSDGTETYYFNSQLFTKFITNVRRSGKTFENLTMQVAWRTPLEKIDALENCLNQWLSTEENRWFEPSTSIMLQHIDFQRFLVLTIGIGHNGNWQVRPYKYSLDWGLRWARKTAFHAAVQHYCRELNITCQESPIPIIYSDQDSQAPQKSPPPSPGLELPATEEGDRVTEPKATLGFLPPPAVRASHLSRARKSKSRKTILRGMDS